MPASLSGIRLLDPDRTKADCDRRGVPTHSWWGKANSFVVPLRARDGVTHGRGFVLVRPSHYDTIKTNTTALSLTFTDAKGVAKTFSPLCLVSVERVVYGADDDSGSAYLLELADRRYRFAQVSVGRSYNTRNDDNSWVTASLNAGVAWTWSGLVTHLWGKLTTAFADFTAAAPTFPAAPAGTPEGFYFQGTDCWAALTRVVEAAGYVLRFDPTTDSADIIDPEEEADDLTDAENKVRIRDTRSVLAVAPPWPENLLVSFPRLGRADRHTVTVSVGEGGTTGTTEVVYDDLLAVGDPVANTTALADRADAVLALWKWDALAAFGAVDREFAGVVDYVRTNLGYRTWAAWAISDRGGSWRNGGLVSSQASCPQWDEDPVMSGFGTASALVTANVDGTQESTTARLEFDTDTGIRVDAGATAADPDVVTLTFGQSITFVECVSLVLVKTRDESDTLIDVDAVLTVKRRTLTVSDGATIGAAVCEDDPADCCPPDPPVVPCCENDIPEELTLTVSGGGGDYPATWNGVAWDTGPIAIPGCGTARLTLTPCTTGDPNTFAVGNVPGVDCAFAVDLSGVVVTCDPFEAVAAGTFSGVGCSCAGKTLTWSIPA